MTKGQKLYAGHRKIHVAVTAELIETSIRSDSSHCMIAESIKQAVPGCKSVAVDLATIRFTDTTKRQRYVYLTPPIAQINLIKFDQGVTFEPFEFNLRNVAQVIRAGRPKSGDQAVQGTVHSAGGTRGVPSKLGGKPPPKAVLSHHRGRTRSFGLRQLQA